MPRAEAKDAAADVTELLHKDHQKVRELFFKFSKAEENGEKEKLVKQILTELFIHATVEEEIVYPDFEKKAEEGEDLVSEAETEHKVVKFLMAELSKMSADDDKFDANVTVLCELVEHHVREEEKEMFTKLRESNANLETLASKVLARKDELMQEPIPEMNAELSIGDKDEIEGKVSELKSKAKKATKKPRTRKAS